MKVKSDHCSKFPNLSNWREEAWYNAQCFANWAMKPLIGRTPIQCVAEKRKQLTEELSLLTLQINLTQWPTYDLKQARFSATIPCNAIKMNNTYFFCFAELIDPGCLSVMGNFFLWIMVIIIWSCL